MRPLLALLLVVATAPSAAGRIDGPLPWTSPADSWRTDRAWYDGRAEMCLYEASRSIYGVDRDYVAIAYTNKQQMDPRTTTKATSDGVEVFKHHWSERVPTENYDYDFSTAVFIESAALAPFKLTASTQEDCGASFKQIWRDGRRLSWFESVYFPEAGMREGKLDADVVFEDALPLVLRDFPFEETGRAFSLTVIPSQKSTRSVPFEVVERLVTSRGREMLDLPAGRIEAWRLDVSTPGGPAVASYWFAAEGAAPWLHALVQYEGAGVKYRLQSIERTAYWERN